MIVISNSLDSSSSGLVVRNFIVNIFESYPSAKVKIVMEKVSDFEVIKNAEFINLGKNNVHNYWQKLFLIIFRVSIIDYWNAKRVSGLLRDVEKINHKVIVFVTGINFFTLYLGCFLLKNQNLSVHLHFLDPIVGKQRLGENKFLNFAKAKVIDSLLRKYQDQFTRISTTNKNFSFFIKEKYNLKIMPLSLISYKVGSFEFSKLNLLDKKEISVYYRGTFNRMRGGDELLSILNKISSVDNRFKFIFQGNIFLENSNYSDFQFLNFLDFSNNDYWLKKADILLDIDVQVEDVYISGKFFEYLKFSKPILVISPLNSAIRDFIFDNYSECQMISVSTAEQSEIYSSLLSLVSKNCTISRNLHIQNKLHSSLITNYIEV